MALHTMAPNEGKLPNLRSLRISTCRDASGLWCLPRAALEVPIDLAARLTELDVSWYQLADSNLEDLMQRAPQCRVRYHGRPLDVECIVARRTDYRHGLIIKEILDSEKLFLEGTDRAVACMLTHLMVYICVTCVDLTDGGNLIPLSLARLSPIHATYASLPRPRHD